jgi:hypothetical protein
MRYLLPAADLLATTTASLARPLALRADKTLRPPAVAMRARNPWVLVLFVRLG